MDDPVTELAAKSRALAPAERVRLLDLLLESLQEPSHDLYDRTFAAEIERRVAAHERGEGALHEVDEVMSEAARIAP